MTWAALIVGLGVALERLAELIYANRKNTDALTGARRRGDRSTAIYPLIVVLHSDLAGHGLSRGLLSAAPLWAWADRVVCRGCKHYALLGDRQPRPLLDHAYHHHAGCATGAGAAPIAFCAIRTMPSWVAEIALLPLAFREPVVALVFSLLNAVSACHPHSGGKCRARGGRLRSAPLIRPHERCWLEIGRSAIGGR